MECVCVFFMLLPLMKSYKQLLFSPEIHCVSVSASQRCDSYTCSLLTCMRSFENLLLETRMRFLFHSLLACRMNLEQLAVNDVRSTLECHASRFFCGKLIELLRLCIARLFTLQFFKRKQEEKTKLFVSMNYFRTINLHRTDKEFQT